MKLVAEIKYKTAKVCDHTSDEFVGKRISHDNDNGSEQNEDSENTLKEFLKICYHM